MPHPLQKESTLNLTLANAPINTQVQQPQYDRSQLKSRIVHIGFGAFHRAHQGLYNSELLDLTNSDWGICEISLYGTQSIEQLRAQNHLYSVLEKNTQEPVAKISGTVVESLHPKLDGIAAVINKLAHPDTSIVSLTITEKGYCADFSTGGLDLHNADIQSDLAQPDQPSTAIGYLVAALDLRRSAKLKPFTVMSCDNIQGNGHVAKQVVLDYAHALDSELAEWIDANATFPCTMVDRIVPAVTPKSRAELADCVGVEDPCGIVCEPFRQWVIEDDFVSGRPNWDEVGASFVSDVTPYEEMKLRMLNGSHSFLAYLGYLGGYSFIYETMEDDAFRKAAHSLMIDEQAVTLAMPENVNLAQYAEHLIARFSNSAIAHETYQIATDGSQKLPQRLCEPLRFHLAKNNAITWLTLGLAGWMVYVNERDEHGKPIEVKDPLLDVIRTALTHAVTAEDVVKSLLSIEQIFGTDLKQNALLVYQLVADYKNIKQHGARKAVAISHR
jgi:fructuronate reductase